MNLLDGTFQPRIPSVGDLLKKGAEYLGITGVFGNWTIIDSESKEEICKFDTFGGYDAKRTSSIPTTNLEKGSFTQYNKINNAGEFKVTLIRSGFPFVLREMLEKLESYQSSTKLVNIELPFKTYLNCNIRDMNHSIKSGQAINQLTVELSLLEIEEVETAYITTKTNFISPKKAKNASDSSTTDKGKNQSLLFKGFGKF